MLHQNFGKSLKREKKKMQAKNKPGGALDGSSLSNPHEINMERFAYDVFVSVFIHLKVTEFPKSDCKPNHYDNSSILSCVSAEVLCRQLYYRDEWMEIFKTLSNRYSFNNIDDFTEIVNSTLKETQTYDLSSLTSMIYILFSVHAELFLFLQSQNKRTNLADLPRSWYKIYTRDISEIFKDDVSQLAKNSALLRFNEFTDVSLSYFLSKYFIPYGANNGCSKIYRLFRENMPSDILFSEEIINFNVIERCIRMALFDDTIKNLPVNKGLGIPPHNLVIKEAFKDTEQSADQAASSSSSSVLPRQRSHSTLSYSQYKHKKEMAKSLSKQSTLATKPSRRPEENQSEETECIVTKVKELTLGSEETATTCKDKGEKETKK